MTKPNSNHSNTVPEVLAQPASQASRVLLRFEEGKACLSGAQVDILKKWIQCWALVHKSSALAIGGACKASRAGMLRRVHFLLNLLIQCGVYSKSMCQDAQWFQPAPMGSIDDLPHDTVWLELLPT